MKVVLYIRTEIPDLKEGESFTEFLKKKRAELCEEFKTNKVFIDVL